MKPEDVQRGDRCVDATGLTQYEVLEVLNRGSLTTLVRVQHQPDLGIGVRELVNGTDVPALVRGPKGTKPKPTPA